MTKEINFNCANCGEVTKHSVISINEYMAIMDPGNKTKRVK